ncbi:MAG: aspartyl protease family protein [Verrucomicrobia bacterium]|nr:aspartyl protease family protein [Actinomycetota bacterium]MBU4199801.1 aspartyl protease family protein [Verrucomicrobiota bacterium]MCG2681398.1 aspartyl protease family protein [Kiritimatiellia bacterium]MBU4247393.1 aspartyl protease family protein [Verrucomicrobiota bacterium]MBU4292121.1 aspartyl protease family protein [Verrucomicrobiota bacterium]
MKSVPLFLFLFFLLPLWPTEGEGNDFGWVAAEPVGRVLMVNAAVNGQSPVRMILDTGATETILTWGAAVRLGLVHINAGGVSAPTMLRTIGVGSAMLTNFSVIFMDPLQALTLRLDKGVDYQGLIGYTFLRNFITTINYRRNRIRIESYPVSMDMRLPARQSAALPGFNIPLQLCDRLLYAQGTVNGQGPITFLIDTGSAEVLLLPRVAEKLRLSNIQSGNEPNVRWTRLNSVALGNAVLSNVTTVIYELNRDNSQSPPYDGILGQPFLSRFLVTIDYRGKRLGLKPFDYSVFQENMAE